MRKFLLVFVLFITAFLVGCSKDEVDTFGYIYGVVLNSSTYEPVQGARVTLTPSGKSTVTGNDGSYEFVELEAGSYKVTIQADGYTSTLKNITVVAGEKALGDISLSPKPQNSKLGVDNDVLYFTKSIRNNTINIQNLGNSGDIDWTITNIPSWLTVSPVQGKTGIGKSSAVQVSLNSSFVDKGDAVLIVNAAGESVSIIVTADITSDGESGGDGEVTGDYSSAKVESCDENIGVSITSCKRSGSNVVFKFAVVNNYSEDLTRFGMRSQFGGTYSSQIADDEGTNYQTSSINFKFNGQSPSGFSIETQLLKSVKTSGEITIKGVPESVKKISVIKISVYNQGGYDFQNECIDFRNIPIY